jgi:hypothetical protein
MTSLGSRVAQSREAKSSVEPAPPKGSGSFLGSTLHSLRQEGNCGFFQKEEEAGRMKTLIMSRIPEHRRLAITHTLLPTNYWAAFLEPRKEITGVWSGLRCWSLPEVIGRYNPTDYRR